MSKEKSKNKKKTNLGSFSKYFNISEKKFKGSKVKQPGGPLLTVNNKNNKFKFYEKQLFLDESDINLLDYDIKFKSNIFDIDKIDFLVKGLIIISYSLLPFWEALAIEHNEFCKSYCIKKVRAIFGVDADMSTVLSCIKNCKSKPNGFVNLDLHRLLSLFLEYTRYPDTNKILNKMLNVEKFSTYLNKILKLRNNIFHQNYLTKSINIEYDKSKKSVKYKINPKLSILDNEEIDSNLKIIFNLLHQISKVVNLKNFNGKRRIRVLKSLIEISKLYKNFNKYVTLEKRIKFIEKRYSNKEVNNLAKKTIDYIGNKMKNGTDEEKEIISKYIINNITVKILDKNVKFMKNMPSLIEKIVNPDENVPESFKNVLNDSSIDELIQVLKLLFYYNKKNFKIKKRDKKYLVNMIYKFLNS